MKETFQEQLSRQIGFIQITPRLSDMSDAEKAAYWKLHDTAQQMADEANAGTLCEGEQSPASCPQIPDDSGDKKNEGNNTTHQPKLEDIHMVVIEDTATHKAANNARIAQNESELAAVTATSPAIERIAALTEVAYHSQERIAADVGRIAAALAAKKKTAADHAVEVGKGIAVVAGGVALASAVKAGVEYLFFKPVG